MSDKILVIDEEDWYMEPILERLTSEGIVYDYCQTVSSALKKLMDKNNNYNIIILDMRLPFGKKFADANKFLAPGLFLFDQIRKKVNSHIPIICYTSSNDNDVIKAIDQENGIYVPKAGPNADNLFQSIRNTKKKI